MANKGSRKTHAPATTPEGRENELISLAANLAEKQLTDGSASSQVITHFLKLASTREQLEQERLHRENVLLSAKVDQIASQKRIEDLYEKALHAMREYAGNEITNYDEDEEL